MLSIHELKKLVGEHIIVIFTVADNGIVVSKSSYSGTLKGRPCKRNFNDFDLFAIKSTRETAVLYIDLRRWVGNKRYMVTLEPIDVLGKNTTPILNITFNPS